MIAIGKLKRVGDTELKSLLFPTFSQQPNRTSKSLNAICGLSLLGFSFFSFGFGFDKERKMIKEQFKQTSIHKPSKKYKVSRIRIRHEKSKGQLKFYLFQHFRQEAKDFKQENINKLIKAKRLKIYQNSMMMN